MKTKPDISTVFHRVPTVFRTRGQATVFRVPTPFRGNTGNTPAMTTPENPRVFLHFGTRF